MFDRDTIDLFGIPFSEVELPEFVADIYQRLAFGRPEEGFLVTFVSPLATKTIKRDRQFQKSLRRIDVILTDGIALTTALRKLRGARVDRISFDTGSLAPFIFAAAEKGNYHTVMFIGGKPGVAEAASRQILRRFPRLRVLGHIDGFSDCGEAVSKIMALNPSVVVCGMGIGKQEEMLVSLVNAGWKGFGFTCGGYLDQLSRKYRYYPRVINALNLRWLYRALREPGLLQRYLVGYQPFYWLVMRELLSRRGNGHQRRGLEG